MARLLSVNVGLPRDIEWKGRTVHTGIWKDPVHGRCRVNRLNLDGDGQGDLAGHGGEQRAVFVYQIESYRHWQEQLKRTDFVHGQFGENFTIEGLPDDVVCIGDRYRIGSALFEVTQPRVTCYRVGIRTNEPRMPALLTAQRTAGVLPARPPGRRGGRRRRDREGGRGEGANDRRRDQRAPLFARAIRASDWSVRCGSRRSRPDGARRSRRCCRIQRLPGEWKRRARAGSGCASDCTWISAARGDGDRSRIRGRPLADDAERGRSAAASGSAGPVRGPASSTERRRPAALSQLLALGSALDGALPNQREDRAGRGGRDLPQGQCPGGRRPRRQLAARKLRPGIRRATGGAAQRGNRGDARAGDAARAGG